MNEPFDSYVDRMVSQISEHCPGEGVAIQILCSWVEPDGGTSHLYLGSGNYYARERMADHFVKTGDSQILANEMPETEITIGGDGGDEEAGEKEEA